jgi:signal transduction histidine kinase
MSIRLRIALWCGTILAVGLLAFSTLIYLLAGQNLRTAADQEIAGRAQRLDTMLSTAGQGGAVDQRAEMNRAVHVFSSSGVAVALLDARGAVLARTPGATIPLPASLASLPSQSFYAGQVAGEPFRVFALRSAARGPVRYVLAGNSVETISDNLATLLVLLLAGSALCLALVAVAVWLLARRVLTPISALTGTAAAIAHSGDFTTRLHARTGRDEVGQLAATFNAMLNRLADLSAAQRRFIADASHELRAPLTTIRGNAELLLLDLQAPAAEREDGLRDIAAEAIRLTRLVDGLLALARGDAGHQARPQPVLLHEVLASVVHVMAEHPCTPALILERCDPAVVIGDPDRLERLLINLLDNALKYTPTSGSVSCALHLDDGWAVFTVRDTGIGIAPADLPHVFERFYRADRARSRDVRAGAPQGRDTAVPGTGLGLAIARQIAEEAGGTISAESSLGQGSTFTVRLPRAEAPRPPGRPLFHTSRSV